MALRLLAALLAIGLSACAEAPLGLAVRITPSPATELDALTVEIATPPAGEEEPEYAYRWFLEGVEVPEATTAVLPAEQTRAGQTWRVVVIPTVSGVSGEVGVASTLIRTSVVYEPVDADADGVFAPPDGDDCDDDNAAISPLAPELCNGWDDNCDERVDEGFDEDGDFVTTCQGDCDDTDPTVQPGATGCDAIEDTDCDGLPDPDERDGDGDGATPCDGDCDDTTAAIGPGVPEVCDGIFDNDCDGVDDPNELDADGDTVTPCDGDCDDSQPSLNLDDLDGDGATPCDGDCDDTTAAAGPGVPEVCDGILDNDCDGAGDPQELDADGDTFTPCDGDCDDSQPSLNLDDVDGDGLSSCDGDCDDTKGSVHPNAPELCDGLDNDCDGRIDTPFDVDGDGAMDASAPGCLAAYGPLADCDDGDSAVWPGAPDVCDGVDDNDCDGVTDPFEADADGDAVTVCGGDCDDTDPLIAPGAPEVLGNGTDDDCDGAVDEAPPSVFVKLTNSSSASLYGWDEASASFNLVGLLNPGSPYNAFGAAVGDFNGDLVPDVMVQAGTNFGSPTVAMWAGDTDGGFARGGATPSLAGTTSVIMGAADLDQDGDDDLVGWDLNYGNGAVFMNTGSGWIPVTNGGGASPFSLQWWSPSSNNRHTVVHMPPIDVTNDAIPDLVECSNTSTSPTNCLVHEGVGNGTFATLVSFSLPEVVNGIAIADFDGDGLLDLIGGFDDDGDAGLAWMWTGGLWSWGGSGQPVIDVNANSGTTASNAPGYGWCAPSDVDGDGDVDVLISSQSPFQSTGRVLNVALNDGTGAFFLQGLGTSVGQWGGTSLMPEILAVSAP